MVSLTAGVPSEPQQPEDTRSSGLHFHTAGPSSVTLHQSTQSQESTKSQAGRGRLLMQMESSRKWRQQVEKRSTGEENNGVKDR